jgi:futalosine hydrolase
LTHSGIGKAAAAAAATSLIFRCKPEALWAFGCGGAYLQADLATGDLALANREIFGDDGVMAANGFSDLAEASLPMCKIGEELFFNEWPVDETLLSWAETQLTAFAEQHDCRFRTGPFVTVSTCTGTTVQAERLANRTGGLCENMEGAAVALACRQHDLPLLELRGISNLVEDRDTGRWDLAAGMTAAQEAVINLIGKWPGQ